MIKISHQPSKHDKAFFLSTIFKFVLVSIARSQHFYKSSLEKSQPSPREYCKIRAMLAMTEQPLEGTLLWELSGVMMKISSTQGQVLEQVLLAYHPILKWQCPTTPNHSSKTQPHAFRALFCPKDAAMWGMHLGKQ